LVSVVVKWELRDFQLRGGCTLPHGLQRRSGNSDKPALVSLACKIVRQRSTLRIVELPIRYRQRTYGETNISRFAHGWMLLKMSLAAAQKLFFTL
jgi:hypothetical protein